MWPIAGLLGTTAWHQLHPEQRTYREPGGALSIVEGSLIRLHVSRLPGRRDREPKTVWLWWHDTPAWSSEAMVQTRGGSSRGEEYPSGG